MPLTATGAPVPSTRTTVWGSMSLSQGSSCSMAVNTATIRSLLSSSMSRWARTAPAVMNGSASRSQVSCERISPREADTPLRASPTNLHAQCRAKGQPQYRSHWSCSSLVVDTPLTVARDDRAVTASTPFDLGRRGVLSLARRRRRPVVLRSSPNAAEVAAVAAFARGMRPPDDATPPPSLLTLEERAELDHGLVERLDEAEGVPFFELHLEADGGARLSLLAHAPVELAAERVEDVPAALQGRRPAGRTPGAWRRRTGP